MSLTGVSLTGVHAGALARAPGRVHNPSDHRNGFQGCIDKLFGLEAVQHCEDVVLNIA